MCNPPTPIRVETGAAAYRVPPSTWITSRSIVTTSLVAMTRTRPREPRRATSASGRQVALYTDCAGDRLGGAQHPDPLRLVLEELDRADVLEVDRRPGVPPPSRGGRVTDSARGEGGICASLFPAFPDFSPWHLRHMIIMSHHPEQYKARRSG